MDDQDRRRALERELRDERARRRDAEQKLVELTERSDLWRKRAEERSERIERLLEAQQRKGAVLRRWARSLSGGDTKPAPSGGVPIVEPPPPQPVTDPRWPRMPATMVVTVVADPGPARALASFNSQSLQASSDSDLDRADLVVVEPAAVASLDAASTDRLTQWATSQARQPLLVWATDGDLTSIDAIMRPQDVTLAAGSELADRLGVRYVPGCFDPAHHNPMSTGDFTEPPLDVSALKAPSVELIERAASGSPFTSEPGAGVAARRWAYRHHAPWVRAAQLLDVVGVPARPPLPSVAALLVSNRPENVPSSVESMLGQTHRPAELILGLHGARATPEIEAVLSNSDIPVAILTFDNSRTLGECLNLCAAESSSPILAKIDSDDHYGPAHLEDSFHALAYSGADIVGKGSHFTYMADSDSTVLRHPGQEEVFIDGSPNGATLVLRREIWDTVGFPHRPRHVDTGFLRAARKSGGTVYAASRWEFCYVRRPSGHTWDAEDEVFLAGSEPAWDGFAPGRVEVSDVDSI